MLYYLAPFLRAASLRVALAAITAFVLGLVLVPLVLRHGRRRGFTDREGKSHSETLNQLHAKKKDTPVLGGLAILAATLAATLLWTRVLNFYVILVSGTLVALGAVGIVDDCVKTFGRDRRSGITPRQKLAAQIAIGLACGALLVLYYDGFRPLGASPAFALDYHHVEAAGTKDASPGFLVRESLVSLHLPLVRDAAIPLGSFVFVAFCALVLTATSNAVNLTDGLDGLAGGCYVLAALVSGALAWIAGVPELCATLGLPHVPGASEVAVICAALAGGTLAFLWHNVHPAALFMGDAGSLPLGGALGLVAVISKQELLLPVVGAVFVAEACSVMLQVAAFKLTGKRVLRCAPLHHHFEFGGWPETKVVARFWILGAIAAAAALGAVLVRK